jgi:hypothetical protein
VRAVRVPDCEALVRFAETLKLRTLARATQEEYLRFVRKLAAQHGGDPSGLDEAQVRAHLLRLKEAHHYSPSSMRTAVFRGRMNEAVRAEAPAQHATLPAGTWRKPWVVHTQPAGSGEAVVRYLARYVGRTAISDGRIVAATDEAVTFRYTDSQTQQPKVCTLTAAEFLRRYLQHVPPPGQHRVRYFGWLHPSAKMRRMKVETLLAKPILVAAPPPEPVQWHLRCPHCERFSLVRVSSLPRQARAPPRCRR